MGISAFSSAAAGMAGASLRFDAATGVANASTAQGPTAGTPDLATELVDATMLAPAAYTANATMFRAADETRQSLLDILA